MTSLAHTTAFGLILRVAAAGLETPSFYLLVAKAAEIDVVRADIIAGVQVQLGLDLHIIEAATFADAVTPSGSIALIVLDASPRDLVSGMDRNIVLLTSCRRGVVVGPRGSRRARPGRCAQSAQPAYGCPPNTAGPGLRRRLSVTPEDELLRLARGREAASERALAEMFLETPDILGRHFRYYLKRRVHLHRMTPIGENVLTLTALTGGVNELACPEAMFSSGARLTFNIQLQPGQRGWCVLRFKFHLHLASSRGIKMVRIDLNPQTWHDPLTVPRCHMHIGDSRAHVPFPIMNPRLILHLLCEHIEPDFGK
jgi:hypothetical protein